VRFSSSKYTKNAYVANYRTPIPPSWFSGSRFAAGERGEMGEGRERGKGNGDSVPHFFFTT